MSLRSLLGWGPCIHHGRCGHYQESHAVCQSPTADGGFCGIYKRLERQKADKKYLARQGKNESSLRE
jgi:hypothetical protein